MIISVDPGESTGIAMWTDAGELIARDVWSFDRTLSRISSEPWVSELKVIVIEDFRLYAKKAMQQVGSRFVACQIIGAFKLLAKLYDIDLVIQPSNILDIAAMHAGIKRVTDHRKSHDEDAYLHGYRYLLDQGLIKPAAQRVG